MSSDHLVYERTGDVAVLRFNDPATLNAMTPALAHALIEAIGRAEGEARAIVLGGEGRGFCSGAKLSGGRFDASDPDRDMGEQLERAYNPAVLRMRASPLPIVTAVRGPAAGIGCAFALAGDLIVAGEGAYFLQAFRHIGLVPDGGSTWLLARAAGRVRAMEMMLLGERVSAATALDWGLINRVVPDAEVDEAALALATGLAAGPAAIGMIKRIAWAAMESDLAGALSLERAAQREAGRTDDFAEGVASFLAKRPPAFTGR